MLLILDVYEHITCTFTKYSFKKYMICGLAWIQMFKMHKQFDVAKMIIS
jgi:hypothetical protein